MESHGAFLRSLKKFLGALILSHFKRLRYLGFPPVLAQMHVINLYSLPSWLVGVGFLGHFGSLKPFAPAAYKDVLPPSFAKWLSGYSVASRI